ncbi:RNA-directed DNA polymerase from mobile element jockey-like [Brachionus plicatilis]|uniref:RNA-directed DNA polymerase from mobile element jockey-like n=1 Tax=Brachionus plicatilis TaxID=10195 RepID=A0A3M7S482_BRAPC|nr:RNA-directed DNA polymerase from mobile element jockey-like [Brachionus plicatilis]
MERPHIVCVSETWYSESSIPCISGYTLYRKDRTGRGGGVCIYVREDHCSMEVTCRVLCADDVEQIWCGVRSGAESLLVGCMYRPPRSNGFVTECVNDSLKEARKMIENKIYDAVVVCGDSNFPEISWTCDGGIASGEKEMRFLEGLDESFIIQCVDFPTFIYGKNGDSSLLDLLFTSEPERVLEVNV